MKVGITEAGDASFDYSWTKKIKDTNFNNPPLTRPLGLAEAGGL